MTRITKRAWLPCLIVLGMALSACGSTSPAQTEQGAIDNLKTVLTAYDSARPRDVTSTGTACATALSGLHNSSVLGNNPGPTKDQRARLDLRDAYLAARAGFADCASGARRQDYVDMARGDVELSSANVQIEAARSAGP